MCELRHGLVSGVERCGMSSMRRLCDGVRKGSWVRQSARRSALSVVLLGSGQNSARVVGWTSAASGGALQLGWAWAAGGPTINAVQESGHHLTPSVSHTLRTLCRSIQTRSTPEPQLRASGKKKRETTELEPGRRFTVHCSLLTTSHDSTPHEHIRIFRCDNICLNCTSKACVHRRSLFSRCLSPVLPLWRPSPSSACLSSLYPSRQPLFR